MGNLLGAALPAFLAWSGVLYTGRTYLRARQDARVASYWWGMVLLALALTTLIRPVGAVIDQRLGVANASHWLANACMLAAGYAALGFSSTVTTAVTVERQRQRWLLISLLLTLMGLAAILAQAQATGVRINFDAPHREVHLVLYRALYLSYFALIVVLWMRSCNHYRRVSSDLLVQASMALQVVGGYWAIGYVVATLVAALSPSAALSVHVIRPWVDLCMLGGVVCVVTGATLPVWGRQASVPALMRHLRHTRACWRLDPFWRQLVGATPEVALPSDGTWWSSLPRPAAMELLLYRHVIEILDSILLLSQYLRGSSRDQNNPSVPHGSPVNAVPVNELHRMARSDARRLASALARQQRGVGQSESREACATLLGYRPATYEDQVRYLELVAGAFHDLRSPIRRLPRRVLVLRRALARNSARWRAGTGWPPLRGAFHGQH